MWVARWWIRSPTLSISEKLKKFTSFKTSVLFLFVLFEKPATSYLLLSVGEATS